MTVTLNIMQNIIYIYICIYIYVIFFLFFFRDIYICYIYIYICKALKSQKTQLINQEHISTLINPIVLLPHAQSTLEMLEGKEGRAYT